MVHDIHSNLVAYRNASATFPKRPTSIRTHGEQYLQMRARRAPLPNSRKAMRIDSLLQLFSLWPRRHVAVGSYSKGMRQRILLIAALMDNPDVLILDEPMSGLDVTSSLLLKNLIQESSGHGKAIFFCSHVLEVVEKSARSSEFSEKAKSLRMVPRAMCCRVLDNPR